MSNLESNRGIQGAKRASWEKPNFRDLGIKIIENNPDAELTYLAEEFIDEVNKHPAYMRSIAIYCMANLLQAVEAKRPRKSSRRELEILPEPTVDELEEEVVQRKATKVTQRILSNLRGLKMPSGKTLADSTGAECRKVGGWFTAIADVVGPRGIVGETMSEADLQKLFAEQKGR